nr:hypothetical protein [Tanacetum cinerariifolium]
MELSLEDELLSFIKELGYSGKCDILSAIHNDQMQYPWRKFAGIINRCISEKTTRLDRLKELRAQILWGMYNQKNVDYVALLWEDFMYADNKEISVVIRDTLGMSVSKKKATLKADRGKGIELLSDAALLEDAQLKKVLEKSRQETYKLQDSGSSEGADFESEGNSEDESDDVNDDDNDDNNANDDDSRNEDDDGNYAHDSKRTDSDDDDNPSFTLKDYGEKEHDEEYKSNDDNKNLYEEDDDDDLYKDVDEESSTQAPFLFTMPETAILEISTAHTTTASPTISMITPFPQLTTPPPLAPITVSTELSQIKQADHSTQLLESTKSQIPTIVDDLLRTRLRYATRTAFQSYTKEFKKKAQEERKLYIDVVEKSVKDIIKDEVKSQLPQILPKEVSDFATPVIQSTINKSLENVILAKSSSQPKSTYEAAVSLTKFELKKILLDKIYGMCLITLTFSP